MQRLRLLLLVAIVAVAFVHYRSHAAPSAREVESALRVYLSPPKSQNCSGSMTLEQLDEVRVGEYAEQFGGWPVYAAHRETCHEENRSSGYSSRYSQTFDGRREGERNVAVASVRRSDTGQFEVFVPGLFGVGERQLRKTILKSMVSIQLNEPPDAMPTPMHQP